MRKRFNIRRLSILQLMMGLMVAFGTQGFAAYHHRGEIDSGYFLEVYPEKAGTKLDSCALCHCGGSYESGGMTMTLGSCQWCHYAYGYDAHGNINETLNLYGRAYKNAGRSPSAIKTIENLDSDGDGYSNKVEIAALRFPGDKSDDPSKVAAPFRVFSRKQLERLPQHTQFLLMNAHKSTDFYATYTGVSLERLLKAAGLLAAATHIQVFAPDGFSQYYPLNPDPNPLFYHVLGGYPATVYYYSEEADTAKNKEGWCHYNSPSGSGLMNGAPIENKGGLKMMLALYREGDYLDPGVLTPQNKLNGEGPFRVVPPQKVPGPPDQRAAAANQRVIWPFDSSADHNAGYSIRSATIIKVEPLPPGTTDINPIEAGWKYVDEAKIMVYGAIDPLPSILIQMDALRATLTSSASKSFQNRTSQRALIIEVNSASQLAQNGKLEAARKILINRVIKYADGCSTSGKQPDKDDWVTDCDLQKKIYWATHDLIVLLGISPRHAQFPK